jgi:uncharacterized integral membrane protein
VSDGFDDRPPSSSGPSVFLVLSVAVAAIIAIFIVQNRERAQIELLFFEFDTRVWFAIAVAIGLGMLLDRLLIHWRRRVRRRREEGRG